MAWFWLVLAGIFELGWMVCLKLSNGFSHLWWSLGMIGIMILSMISLGLAIRVIPMGTAYAIWTGIGAAGIALVGMLYFGEPASWIRITCIGCVLAGILGLKLTAIV